MVSNFRENLSFFETIGIFDVVLPFLLVFTIVFAILEKTKVFGTDDIGGVKYSKKNLNAITAFCIAFLVIASAQLVEILTKVSSQIVVLLFLSVFFLLLVGSFAKEGEPIFLEGGWKTTFIVIMFVGILGIFLNALKTDSGETWLEKATNYIAGGSNDKIVGSIVLLGVMVMFIAFIVKEPKQSAAKH